MIRDRQMDELQIQFPEYGFGKHKGYPTEMHRQAINRLGLTPFHRLSFCRKDNLQIEMFP